MVTRQNVEKLIASLEAKKKSDPALADSYESQIQKIKKKRQELLA